MNSTSSKTSCASCDKGVGQFKCEGCAQSFCTKHVAEHRQTLNQQLDEVILEHDILQQTIMEDKNQCQHLMFCIDQWEQKSIDKIRQLAIETRHKVTQLVNTQKKMASQELRHLTEQVKKAREDDDFFERDLRNWISTLEKLKQSLTSTSLLSDMKEDETASLVYPIRIFSSSSKVNVSELSEKKCIQQSSNDIKYNIFERCHGASGPVNKIHSRLQYTNHDGIYVNPKSFFVTAIWYFYSPKHNRWFWTPYKNYDIWMPVDKLTVKSGFYKDHQPAQINLEIIEYLRQNNPIPPDAIIQTASEAENRILKL